MNGSARHEAAAEPPVAAARFRPGRGSDATILVKAAQRGSPDAVEALVRMHWDDSYRAALLIVHDPQAAEDIAQESMLAAVTAIGGFDRRRSLRPWLHRIVVNRALDSVRARSRRSETALEHANEPASEVAADSTLSPELAAAFSELVPEDRAIVVLRHLLDYRSREIGRLLGLPAGTVRRRLRSALNRLRLKLEEASDER